MSQFDRLAVNDGQTRLGTASFVNSYLLHECLMDLLPKAQSHPQTRVALDGLPFLNARRAMAGNSWGKLRLFGAIVRSVEDSI
ncbi:MULTISPECIES: hypothetical protein [Trichocoleus]|uniref:Uncharacterized protein n=1 Tax=Trichocoleus desertorum GB2-A4 TaxID=2933944 RepID=A0ABV0JGI7_9CYAN|nr:hypothetical protein [Trichocoleus sp. FACHB-46]MBD1864826.1 hypothetical protein [Trichocoleus sp. FACHB-46]